MRNYLITNKEMEIHLLILGFGFCRLGGVSVFVLFSQCSVNNECFDKLLLCIDFQDASDTNQALAQPLLDIPLQRLLWFKNNAG